jgi:hypothetical protein
VLPLLMAVQVPVGAQTPGSDPGAAVPPASGAVPAPGEPPAAVPAPTPAPAVAPVDPVPAPGVGAAEVVPAIKPQLTASTVSPGQNVVLSYRLEGVGALESYPREIEVDGLGIRFAGVSTQQMFSNGTLKRFVEMRYVIEAENEGTFTIPAQSFTVDGKQMVSEPATITVKEGAEPLAEGMNPQVQLSVGKTEIWKGEIAPVTVTVLMHPAVQIASQLFPTIASEGFAVARFDRVPSLDLQDVGNETWRVYRAQSVMTAMKPGKLVLGPADVKADVLMPMAGGFRDPFGGMPSSRRSLKLKSNSIEITVKDLPPGKPEGFAGAVGSFRVMGRADGPGAGPWTVQLGDPVAFELAVTGTGNFDRVGAPVLENATGLRTYPAKVAQENRDWGLEPGQKVFSQLVFPEQAGTMKAVYALSFFNPATGKYETVKTEPLELVVTGQPEAAVPAAAAGDGAKDFATAGVAMPDEDLQDILPQLLPAGGFLPVGGTMVAAPGGWWHALPAGLAALIFAGGMVRRNRAEREAKRPQPGAPRELSVILGELRAESGNAGAFYRLVSEYVNAWTRRKGREVPEDAELAAVLGRRDVRLYAGAAGDEPLPADERATALRVLGARLAP